MLAQKANLHGTSDRDKITFCASEGEEVGDAIMKEGFSKFIYTFILYW